jgi:hypothetical protein
MSTKLPRDRIVIAIAAMAVAAATAVWMFIQDERQGAQIEALYAALGDEQSNIEDLGGEPVAPDPEDLIDNPEYSGPAGPTGPPGPGPSDAQVYAAVAAYFVDHPITAEGPSSAEIAAAVAEYLRDYPPGPTPEQVSAAVASYLTANPPADGEDGQDGAPGAAGPSGPPGPQGETGPPPTAEAIAAEVEQFMTENPLPPTCWAGYEFTPATLVTLDGPPLESVVCAKSPGP